MCSYGFFMYWEDADWCRRIGLAGYEIHCVPSARVIHHEGQSSHGRPPRLVWSFHYGVYRLFTKHWAPQPWNPLRLVAAVGLTARAGLIIGMDALLAARERAVVERSAAGLSRTG